MLKTIFIHNGTTNAGLKIIQNLLLENDYTTGSIKNKVICADIPENISKVQNFLNYDEFTYLPVSSETPIDINETISKVIILQRA